MNREHAIFSAVIVGIVSILGVSSFAGNSQSLLFPSCGFGCPPMIIMSYQPCISGYSGFEVTRQYPNPSTWTFELSQGSTGYLFYQYNVTKGVDLFTKFLTYPWTIWQTYENGSFLSVDVAGSTIIHVQYNVLNQFPVTRPNDSYPLTVQLSVANYSVKGDQVDVTWAVTGHISGTYQTEADDLEWHTIVVAPLTVLVNATSETFSGSCGTGGTVDFNGQ